MALWGEGIAICTSVRASGKRSSKGGLSCVLRELMPGIICPAAQHWHHQPSLSGDRGVLSCHFIPTVSLLTPNGCAGTQLRVGGRMGTSGTQHPAGNSSRGVTAETTLSSVQGPQGIKGWGDSWAGKDCSSYS